MRYGKQFTVLCITATMLLLADEAPLPEPSDLVVKAEKLPAKKKPSAPKAAAPAMAAEPAPSMVEIVQTDDKASKKEIALLETEGAAKNAGWDGHRQTRYQNGWSLDAEFLWWKVAQEGLEYVTAPNTELSAADQTKFWQTLGKYKSAHLHWNGGVRVGAGYTFSQDNWQLFGEYTNYQSHGSHSVDKPSDSKIISGTFTTVSGPPVALAKSRIHLKYNAADLMLARSFLPTNRMLFNLSMGATAAWIAEGWHFDYLSQQNTLVDQGWNFKGGGVRAKLDNYWHLGRGFSFFNKLSAAALLGSFHFHGKITNAPYLFTDHANPLEKCSYKNSVIMPTTYIAIGADWSKDFGKTALTIALGVEATTWYNLHQLYKFTAHSSSIRDDRSDLRNVSNVNLYGSSFRVALDF